jgi:hypothetical protein
VRCWQAGTITASRDSACEDNPAQPSLLGEAAITKGLRQALILIRDLFYQSDPDKPSSRQARAARNPLLGGAVEQLRLTQLEIDSRWLLVGRAVALIEQAPNRMSQ